jgi:hypothetical protein
MPKPRNTDEPEPSTYFEIEQRRLVNPREEKASGDISSLPELPASSPWHHDPVPDEPTIDRTEDAATGGPNILEVDNG